MNTEKKSPLQSILESFKEAKDFTELEVAATEARNLILNDIAKEKGPCDFGQSDVTQIHSAFLENIHNTNKENHSGLFYILQNEYKMDNVSLFRD